MDPPKAMKALVVKEGAQVHVQDKLVPKLQNGDILVENKAIALNPTDWKHVKWISPPGAICGCDFAGVVSEVGPGVQNGISIGDRVAGFVVGGREQDEGAFAQYLKVPADLVWKIPDGTSFEEAAAIGGIAMETAAQALYMRIGLPYPGTDSASDQTVLVWAGSSSVGMYAIQMAKATGARVVTTASLKNHSLLKSFGADAAFDYKDPDVVKKIKEWAGEPGVTAGVDCVSEKGSTGLAGAAFGSRGGMLVTLLPSQDEVPSNVTKYGTLVYTAFGRPFKMGIEFPASPEDRAGMAKWLGGPATELVSSGQLKANPLRRCPGGLEKISEGFAYMEAGKVSAEKLVYSVADEFNPVPEPLA